jgi:hypothetical protein
MNEPRGNEEEWEEGGEYEGEEEEEEGEEGEDDDIDAAAEAEAEEIARRLGDQLWESISKAQAESMRQAVSSTLSQPRPSTKRYEAALTTIKTILALVEKDSLAPSIFASTLVPEYDNKDMLHVLTQIVATGNISKDSARPLSDHIVTLARSEVLFASLRSSGRIGKRARAETDDVQERPRDSKRQYHSFNGLENRITESVRKISNALDESPGSLDASVISSIRLELHQVFIFSVTSSTRGGPEMNSLREVSGLIQVLGVLSGVSIGATSNHPVDHSFSQTDVGPAADIGTAVYPCLAPSCHKFFSRLYNFRAHQRTHSSHRPFVCPSCPATFTRSHDLKRHNQLHQRKAWKCCGCDKVFSRRDAIKRHKNNESSKGPDGKPCLNQKVLEIDLEPEGGNRKCRRSKKRASSASFSKLPHDEHGLENGEIPYDAIARAQAAVLSLGEHVQNLVRNTIGAASGKVNPVDIDPIKAQAALAGIIAQVQAESQRISLPPFEGQSFPSAHDDPTANQEKLLFGIEAPLAAYGLSEEQTRMLQQAIANTASAAQAQAEAEAAMEEQEEEEYNEGNLRGSRSD